MPQKLALLGVVFAFAAVAVQSAAATQIGSIDVAFSATDITTCDGTTTVTLTITGSAEAAATLVSYTASPSSAFTVTGATASKGSVFWDATGVTWQMFEVDQETVTLTYTLHHTGTSDDPSVPLHSSATLFWKDAALGIQAAPFDEEAISISGCNSPPVAYAGPDQTVGLSGSATTNVTLDGTGSTDDGQPDPLSYSWSEGGTQIATGATPTVALGAGVHTITLTVSDGDSTDTDDVVITVGDSTPPVIVKHVDGTLGLNGWYTSDVHVWFEVSDPESGPPTTSGCDSTNVTTDTTGTSFTCSATSAGGTSNETATVLRDATAPVIQFTGNLDVYAPSDTVDITCSVTDTISGLAASTCPEAHGAASTFPPSNTLNATATDMAGNTATASATFVVQATAAGICGLVRLWVDGEGNGKSLCAKLGNAADAKRRGDVTTFGNVLNAFANELHALAGKKVTADDAEALIALARQL